MDQLIAAIPLIISASIPPLLSFGRGWFLTHVDPKWYPILLSVGGGVIGALAHFAGVDAAILSAQTTDVSLWQTTITGVTSGLASVGIHQIYKQQVKQ